MASSCNIHNIQSLFLKETGIHFHEWKALLLASGHDSYNHALYFLLSKGLSKNKAEFLLQHAASQLSFTENKKDH